MKKVLFTITAASALAAFTPAAGQNMDSRAGASPSFATRIAQINTRFQTGVDAGVIDRTEQRSLRTQINQLSRLERQYSRNGLTETERQDLQQRLRSVRQDLARADDGARGRYASWDRDWDREDSYTGVGGPVETGVPCQVQSGIGGVLAGVLNRATGNVDSDCGLEVGQRVPGKLGAVPTLMRSQYRDGNGVYYRADGQNVYRIDNRSHVVTEVFPMTR